MKSYPGQGSPARSGNDERNCGLPTLMKEAIERSRRITRLLARTAAALLLVSAGLTAVSGRWWNVLYLVALSILVLVVLGRKR